jgi:N-hydroxyarylamine O-acetyltransferase
LPETFNLDAYLARIGFEGDRSPTLSTLQAIHALQPAAIPFEGLDPFLQRSVSLDLSALQAKLVDGRRGGYCFELNTLFAAALEALGFAVTNLTGRVRWMAPPERPMGGRTHHLLRVDIEGLPYLADVGFGGHLLAGPIRLEAGLEQQTPASLVRLVEESPALILQTKLPGGWQDLYWFTLELALPIDFEIGNWFTSTNPASRFHKDFLAERLTPELRLSVFNTKVTERRANGETNQRFLSSAEEFAALLEEGLGVTPPVDPAEIWSRLPKT